MNVTPTPAQEQAALAWLSLLHDAPSSGDQATFSRWLRADPAHVEAALRSLPERTRHILLLNRIHGRKYADIAKAMGLSQSEVEKHMMRALEACKASLREPSPPRTPGKAP